MNKKILISTFLLSLFFAGCGNSLNKDNRQTENIDDKEVQQMVIEDVKNNEFEKSSLENYLGSEFKGNYVWGGAMNLAWNELSENIIKEKIKLATDDKTALEMVNKFNNPVFIKKDLDEESYYIKSGYGQKTVDVINKESKEKFPSKSFADLDIQLAPTDIISYAYFLKEVEYLVAFEENKSFIFDNQNVEGFYADGEKQKENIKVVDYKDDNNFIVKLALKNEGDELFLAKGFDMENPKEVVESIINKDTENLESISENDIFKAPKIELDMKRDYDELIEKYLANNNFTKYFISQMFENIKFKMDEKGARVENEAVITLSESIVSLDSKPVKIRKFILDKPYWVVMKRKDSKNPYFILGIENTELMKKLK